MEKHERGIRLPFHYYADIILPFARDTGYWKQVNYSDKKTGNLKMRLNNWQNKSCIKRYLSYMPIGTQIEQR